MSQYKPRNKGKGYRKKNQTCKRQLPSPTEDREVKKQAGMNGNTTDTPATRSVATDRKMAENSSEDSTKKWR